MDIAHALPSIFPVTCHTDYVGPGSTFVAIPGLSCDGAQFVPAALEKGATRIVVQRDAVISSEILDAIAHAGATVARVADCRKALAQLSVEAAGFPADKLRMIAITGTKGKTTTAFLLEHMLRGCGICTALLSTAGVSIGGYKLPPTQFTTPQADYLQQFLARCVEAGVTHVVMEVAAQAVTMHRVDGLVFDGLIFTNLALEHLEFYPSMEAYFSAKAELCDRLKMGASLLIGRQDEWCGQLCEKYPQAKTFGDGAGADYAVEVDSSCSETVSIELTHDQYTYRFELPSLCGYFNGINLAGAVGMAMQVGCEPVALAESLQSFEGIPGRLQRYQLPNGAIGIIDYAHNPLSYEALLSTLRAMTNKLIVVFGAGGDRDSSRRPQMGQIAAHYADHVVLTSDNPRTEDPTTIIDQISVGVVAADRHKITRILDRHEAIHHAYELSCQGAIIALLGKGPDEYQIVGSCRTRFSERDILRVL